MSYQVLARKWRPRTFTEMVGQEHVLKALVNGLDNGRLHHAYLFTGTRGVGKTTLARIIAKCLNCEQGVSSSPCGECGACRAIAEGRFVDLLEVDAASRTKVEDTREMLDNVQYLPTSGRYKVYLIDEVHMLSTHSFNALLKTLEEPPPHVKFLLATTDPQKLPVTILSRCLQFNLKNLGPERIVGHLKHVLGEENVPFEEDALWALGRAADGSMRDALSLTDQAIAHGGGQVTGAEVNAMLGTIDRNTVVDICAAVAAGNAGDALALVQKLADHAPDYSDALAEMLSFWHRVAIAQTAPDALDQSHGDHHRVLQLAADLGREDVQLFYQITLLGRRDLPHAADSRSGFEMVLLRLLAFQPRLPEQIANEPLPRRDQGAAGEGRAASAKKPEQASSGPAAEPAPPVVEQQAVAPGGSRESSAQEESRAQESFARESFAGESGATVGSRATVESGAAGCEDTTATDPAEPGQAPSPALTADAPRLVSEQRFDSAQPSAQSLSPAQSPQASPAPHLALVKAVPEQEVVATPAAVIEDDQRPPWEEYEAELQGQQGEAQPSAGSAAEPGIPAADERAPAPAATRTGARAAAIALDGLNRDSWIDVYLGLEVAGLLQNIAANLALDAVEGKRLRFTLDSGSSSLYKDDHQGRLAEAFSGYFGEPVEVVITIASPQGDTPWMILQRRKAERLEEAKASLRQDSHVRAMATLLGGELLDSTVRPID
ncbi:MAG: DNA polymerase III subunit gamma/tau [Porticoccaceae bacterium]